MASGNNQKLLQKDSPLKPRVVTIVLPTATRPYKKSEKKSCISFTSIFLLNSYFFTNKKRISLLLNRRSAASLEQLMLDITEAFQIPRWHNGKCSQTIRVLQILEIIRLEMVFLRRFFLLVVKISRIFLRKMALQAR